MNGRGAAPLTKWVPVQVVPSGGGHRSSHVPNCLYAVGDNQGYLTLHHPGTACLGRNASGALGLTTTLVCLSSTVGLFRVGIIKAHNDIVKTMLPVPRVGLISSAMDGTLVATDFNKCQVVRTFEGHTRGLYAMDWCGAEKFMVSQRLVAQGMVSCPLSWEKVRSSLHADLRRCATIACPR